MRVYLGGAIELVSPDRAKSWRDEVRRLCEQYTEWQPVDPLLWEPDEPPYNDEQIVNTDRHLLKQCDVLLLDGRQPGWGSAMEAAWAYADGKPIVVWGIEREKAPVFLRHHATIFEKNLPDAVLRVGELSL